MWGLKKGTDDQFGASTIGRAVTVTETQEGNGFPDDPQSLEEGRLLFLAPSCDSTTK